MTQQQKLKEVVEATGGCWHSGVITERQKCKRECVKCHAWIADNPSPSDLNALFDLAEKLVSELDPKEFDQGFWLERVRPEDSATYGGAKFVAWFGTDILCQRGDTPAEALLNSLHEAVKK